MIIFKTILTDKQIQDYVRPEGTKNPECGGGINCAFCTLKMLGVYNPDLEEKSKTCAPRFRAGNTVKTQEYVDAIKQVVADMTDEKHEFAFIQEIGQPSASLANIARNLDPLEACYFIYGRTNGSAHAVVLRKNADGEVELIDPQRGSDDIGKQYGFTAERAAELGIELTPQYYRVKGIPAIEEVMIEQSVLFKYWTSKDDLLSDLAHFVVACVMVDSVVGLKMLIDDPDTSRLMDVEETITPNQQMDIEAAMEGSGKGDEDEETDMGYETQATATADAIQIPSGSKIKDGSLKTLLARMEVAFESESEREDESEIDPALFQTIVKLLGTPDGNDVITHLLELSEDDLEDKEEEQVGGAAVMITPKDYLTQMHQYWDTHQAEDRVNSTFFLMKKALELYNVERIRTSKKGILVGYESPNPTGQCKVIGKNAVGNICWLCGGFAPYKWENLKPETQMGICNPASNRRECEHVLPINLMYFLKTLVNTKVPPTTAIQKKLQAMLYDNSCRLCNGKKDNGLYIRTQTIDGDIEPHVLNILSDVLAFFTVYCSTTSPCSNAGGTMGTPPRELSSVGSLVHVKGKYYPNVIRAQLNPGFVSGGGGGAQTIQAQQAEKAQLFTGSANLLTSIRSKYPTAYEKLTAEPDIDTLYTSQGGKTILPQITAVLKGTFHTSTSLDGAFKDMARVDQKVAVDWVLRRFCIIYERMSEVCAVLNSPEGKALWNTQTDSIISGTGQPMQEIKVLAIRNNGPESERVRTEKTTKESSVIGEYEEESEMEGQQYPIEAPPAKRARKGGEMDISVHRGGQRVIDVDL